MRMACYLLSWLSCYAPPSEYPKRSERKAGNVLSQTDYCDIKRVNFNDFSEGEIVAYKDKLEHWIYAKITVKSPGSCVAVIEYQVPVRDSVFKRNYCTSCYNLRKLPTALPLSLSSVLEKNSLIA